MLQAGSSSPTWNQTFSLAVDSAESVDALTVQVFSEDPDATQDAELGKVEFPASDLSTIVQQGAIRNLRALRLCCNCALGAQQRYACLTCMLRHDMGHTCLNLTWTPACTYFTLT